MRSIRRTGESSRNCGTWDGWFIPLSAAPSRSARRPPPRPTSPTPIRARSRTRWRGRRRCEDISRITEDYVSAAENAIAAGFDGVQLHGANGYLIDQFLRDSANFRTDDYGGSIENRLRFVTQVLEAVGSAIGMDRVGDSLFAQHSVAGRRGFSDPFALFTALAARLEELKCRGSNCARRTGRLRRERSRPHRSARRCGRSIRARSCSTAIMTGRARGRGWRRGWPTASAFGRPFIANPDLVHRIAISAPLNVGDEATYYSGGAEGYVDYPALDEAVAA